MDSHVTPKKKNRGVHGIMQTAVTHSLRRRAMMRLVNILCNYLAVASRLLHAYQHHLRRLTSSCQYFNGHQPLDLFPGSFRSLLSVHYNSRHYGHTSPATFRSWSFVTCIENWGQQFPADPALPHTEFPEKEIKRTWSFLALFISLIVHVSIGQVV